MSGRLVLAGRKGLYWFSDVADTDFSTATQIISADDGSISVDVPVVTTNLTTTGNTILGNASSDTLTVNSTSAFNYPVTTTVVSTSDTPSGVRSIIGAVSDATTITAGLLTGVRGATTVASASGGYIYGTQGKVIATGTLSGSSWTAGLFGQFDISAATVNAGQTAAIWGDYGTTSGTISNGAGMRGVAMTNTTAAVLNAQDYRYGNATYLMELAGAGGTLNYYLAAGKSAGSAGDTSKCNALHVLKIEINGVAGYIPVFVQNT